MALVDKARAFIEHGSGPPSLDQIEVLRESIETATLDALHAVQLMFGDMYGGITYNYLLKALVPVGHHGSLLRGKSGHLAV